MSSRIVVVLTDKLKSLVKEYQAREGLPSFSEAIRQLLAKAVGVNSTPLPWGGERFLCLPEHLRKYAYRGDEVGKRARELSEALRVDDDDWEAMERIEEFEEWLKTQDI